MQLPVCVCFVYQTCQLYLLLCCQLLLVMLLLLLPLLLLIDTRSAFQG